MARRAELVREVRVQRVEEDVVLLVLLVDDAVAAAETDDSAVEPPSVHTEGRALLHDQATRRGGGEERGDELVDVFSLEGADAGIVGPEARALEEARQG